MKKKLTNSTALALASAVLSNSCNSVYFTDQLSTDQFAVYDVSKEFIPVDMLIDDASFDYLNGLSKMFNDVYTNKKSRKLLRESPSLFFAQYNISSEVDMKNSEFKLLFALTDEEILTSLRCNDIQSFLRLCKERDYFTNIEFSEEVLKLSKTISEHPEIQESLQGLPQEGAVYVIPFAAVAAAAVYVVVVYNFGAGINWVAGVIALLEVMVASRPPAPQRTMMKSIIKDENIFRLWINKDEAVQRKLIEEYARQIIEIDSSL